MLLRRLFESMDCRLSLGMHSQLAIAAVRCVVQLSLLGYILAPIFKLNSPWLVLAYAGFMVWVSALEAMGRPSRVYKVLQPVAVQSMCFS
jgi:putative ABC transport system permease protein